jgi:GNAT superfamily N-acetyltransferase
MAQPAQVAASFRLPAALVADGFALRPERDDDDKPFLLALYGSTRADELAQTPWSDEQKAAFLAMQFAAQRRHYRAHMPDAVWLVLEHAGEPIGRLYLEDRGERLHVVDISLVPAWRGRGLGGRIFARLIETAEAAGLGVGIFVEKFNPALRLYRRLGFVEVGDTGVYLEMERSPGALDAAASRSASSLA